MASPVQAQQQTGERTEVSLSARALYDSNIARSSEAVARARGVVPEDVRFSPALETDIARGAGRHLFYFVGIAGADLHARNTRLDRERLQARAGVTSSFARCRTTLETSLARRQSDLQDIFISDVRNTESLASVLGRVSCPRPAGLFPTGEVQALRTENSNQTRRDADNRTLRAEAALNYGQPSFGEAALFFRYSETEYPNRLVFRPGGGTIPDRFEFTETGIVLSRNVGSLLHGSVSVAYGKVGRTTDADAFEGISYAARLRLRPQQRLSANLTAERTVSPSNRIGISYSVDKAYAAELIYRLSSRTEIAAGGSIRDRRYEAAPQTVISNLTDEETRALFASMRIGLSDRIRLAVDARREERDADLSLFDYVSSRVELSASLVF